MSEYKHKTVMRLLSLALVISAALAPNATYCFEPEIVTADIERFFDVYDAGRGQPDAEQLQYKYIDVGTDGLNQFMPDRIISAFALSSYIRLHQDIYTKARQCSQDLTGLKLQLTSALNNLRTILPESKIPPVTLVIGRNNSGGTTGQSGVIIGLEVLCRSNWLQKDLVDRFAATIVHEYGHVQQPPEDPKYRPTLLWAAIAEGGAELVAALAFGAISNLQLEEWTNGREEEIEKRFLASRDSTDFGGWLYKGPGTPANPGDLAYWVGYRICKFYYESHGRSATALNRILSMADVGEILASSGWAPGAKLPGK